MSTVDFDISGSPSSDRGYDALNGETLTLTLEASPALDIRSIQYSVQVADGGAPALVFSDSGAPAIPTDPCTTTLPVTGTRAYLIRAVANGGKDPDGTANPDYTRERLVVIRNASGLRKMVIAETTQYDGDDGWAAVINDMVDTFGGAAQEDVKNSVRLATAAAMPASTRVGNVRTADANGAMPTIDGVAPQVGDPILDKDNATAEDRGIWEIDSLGSAGTKYQMTRRSDFDTSAEVTAGAMIPTGPEGTDNGSTLFLLGTADPITINVTGLTFVKSSASIVTTLTPGTVNALGGADTVLTSDGVTPGGVWGKLGTASLTPGANSTALQTNAGGSVVWAALAVAALTAGADNTVMQTTSGAASWEANVSLGATPAGQGRLRLTEDDAIVWKGASSGDISGLWMTGSADNINLGGTFGTAARPANINIHAETGIRNSVSGSQELTIYTGYVEHKPSGATVALEGMLRLPAAYTVGALDNAGTGTVSVLQVDSGADSLTVGGTFGTAARPSGITYDATSAHLFRTAGTLQLLVADSYLSHSAAGATVAGEGTFRVPDDYTVCALDAAGTGNLSVWYLDGADGLTFGGTQGTAARPVLTFDGQTGLVFQVNGATAIGADSLSVNLSKDNLLWHATNATAPNIGQYRHTSTHGVDLTIQAQQGFTSGDVGGDLILQGGADGGGGSGDFGKVLIKDGGGTTRVAVSEAGNLTTNVAGSWVAQIGGGQKIYMTAAYFDLTLPFQFGQNLATPSITHSTHPSGAGNAMSISAQDAYAGGAAFAGADLSIRPGAGGGGGAGGTLTLAEGDGTASLTIGDDGYVKLPQGVLTSTSGVLTLQYSDAATGIRMTATEARYTVPRIEFILSATAPSIGQQQATGTDNGRDLTIQAQQGASGAYDGGNLVLQCADDGGSGTPGYVAVNDSAGGTVVRFLDSYTLHTNTIYNSAGDYSFGATNATPGINQQTNTTTDGYDLTIVAQQGHTAFDGGDLILQAGALGAGGAHGQVLLKDGGGTNRFYIEADGDVVINAATNAYVKGGGVNSLWCTSTFVEIGVPLVLFDITVASPVITQQTPTSIASGYNMVLHAQDAYASAAGDGGTLYIRGGNKGTSGSWGSTIIEDGGSTARFTVESDGDVVTNAATSLYLQAASQTVFLLKNTFAELHVPNLLFDKDVTSPATFTVETEGSDATTTHLLIQGQTQSYDGGSGGNVTVKAGDKTGTGLGANGKIYLDDADGDHCLTVGASGAVDVNAPTGQQVALQVNTTDVLTVAGSVVTAVQPLALGSSVSSTGDLRLGDTFTITAKTGAGQIPVLTKDGSENLTMGGDTVNSIVLSVDDGAGSSHAVATALEDSLSLNRPLFFGANGVVETSAMTGNETLDMDDPQFQFRDPDASGREMTLPAAAAAYTGHWYFIANTGTGGHTIVVKDGAGTIVTITDGCLAWVICNGTAWGSSPLFSNN